VQLGFFMRWRAAKDRPMVPAPMMAILIRWSAIIEVIRDVSEILDVDEKTCE
jgi:hypothetical protein